MSPSAPGSPSIDAVRAQLRTFQEELCAQLESIEPDRTFDRRAMRSEGGGTQLPRVLQDGAVLEKAAVHFSHRRGQALPPAATTRRPELAGALYEAVSVSVIVHPRNPFAPTSHANFRYFQATPEGREPVWWFGGGFDLTPYYGFDEDCVRFHQAAQQALRPLDPELYPRMKEACDAYFRLPHRGEPRGIGGVFYDDFCEGGFENAFAVHCALSRAFPQAYLPLLRRRSRHAFGERHRQWQCIRRGRYAEFNLLYDRGTRFGLESGGRVESILASMPPLVRWVYDHVPEAGSEEDRLLRHFLVPRDWANMTVEDSGLDSPDDDIRSDDP